MQGLFFDDPGMRRKDARLRPPPPIPATGWKCPIEFPNLSAAKHIAFDTETKDLKLNDNGPGWARKDSHIVGVSLAAEAHDGTRGAWYFPIRHEMEPHLNMDVNNVLAFTDHVLNTPTDKFGVNLTYDIGNLQAEGVRVGGRLHDMSFAEALIDSNALVGLDPMAHKYLNTGKVSDHMYEWIRQAYPNTPEKFLRREIYRTPPSLVGHYAEGDAWQPLEIYKQQERILWNEGLMHVFRLECDLIPMMVAMRKRGVRVDLEKAEKLYAELIEETALMYRKVREDYGWVLHSTDSRQLGPFLEHVGIDVPRNPETGNYSVKKEFLAALHHPAADLVGSIREHEKITGTFIKSYIFGQNIDGFLFPQFHQLKGDENGTMVGRFASSDPNLQNIPSRTKLGKRVRECFVPDEGHVGWRKFDFSQVHYRLLAHFAVDAGDGSAEALRERYRNDPKTDYHVDVMKNVAPFMGWDLSDEELVKMVRRPVKNFNFGLLYGQSEKALAYKSGMSDAQAKQFSTSYHSGAPYVRATMEAIGREVQEFGYITTVLGRRIRFEEWEPIRKNWDNPEMPLPYNAALAKWGAGIRRAYEYRGVNYKFQGSEPDIMKTAMRNLWNSGVFEYTGVPSITVHDELDWSVPNDDPITRQAFDYVQKEMQEAIKLRIPVFVDESNGPSWGKAD